MRTWVGATALASALRTWAEAPQPATATAGVPPASAPATAPPIATGQSPPGPPSEPARRGPVLGIEPDGFYLGTVDSGF